MKVLIEAGVFPEEQEKLIAALTELRVEHSIWSKEGRPPYKSADNHVFFYGSIATALQLKAVGARFQLWIGEAFDYTYFTAHLEDCLNQEIVALPYGSILREWNKEEIDNDRKDKLFFRSNSGYKKFQGGLYTASEFMGEADRVNLFKEDLIVAAEPQKIEEEYRAVIRSQYDDTSGLWAHRVVTHSSYTGGCALNEAQAKSIEDDLNTATYHPYPLWILDLATCDGRIFQLEANSINTSGLYTCDYVSIVKEILKIEEEEIV